MTAVSLIDASAALDKRKNAVFDAEAEALDTDQVAMWASGFDLDIEELRRLAEAVACSFLDSRNMATIRPTSRMIVRGAFVEGLLTGLMLAKLRDEEAS